MAGSRTMIEEIMSMRQTGTVSDYCNTFQEWFKRVQISKGFNEFYGIYLFIWGLEPEIGDVFDSWHQYSCNTVDEVISLALKVDANGLRDSFSPFDPESSFYKKELEWDTTITLDELMKDNEFFRNGKIQETIIDEVIDETDIEIKSEQWVDVNEIEMNSAFVNSAYRVFDEMPDQIGGEFETQFSDLYICGSILNEISEPKIVIQEGNEYKKDTTIIVNHDVIVEINASSNFVFRQFTDELGSLIPDVLIKDSHGVVMGFQSFGDIVYFGDFWGQKSLKNGVLGSTRMVMEIESFGWKPGWISLVRNSNEALMSFISSFATDNKSGDNIGLRWKGYMEILDFFGVVYVKSAQCHLIISELRRKRHYATLGDTNRGRNGQLEEATIKGMDIAQDKAVWLALLGAYKLKLKNNKIARVAAEALTHLETGSSVAHALLHNMYDDTGQWDDTNELRELMEVTRYSSAIEMCLSGTPNEEIWPRMSLFKDWSKLLGLWSTSTSGNGHLINSWNRNSASTWGCLDDSTVAKELDQIEETLQWFGVDIVAEFQGKRVVDDLLKKVRLTVAKKMRILKFYGWEMKFLSRISDITIKEIHWLCKNMFTLAKTTSTYWMAITFEIIATFRTSILVGNSLEKGKLLSVLATFRILHEYVLNFQVTTSTLVQIKVSLDCISLFLRLGDLDSHLVEMVLKGSTDFAVGIVNRKFSWDMTFLNPTLTYTQVRVVHDMWVVVCGTVSLGKSKSENRRNEYRVLVRPMMESCTTNLNVGLPRLHHGWFFKPKKKELDISVPTTWTGFENVASSSIQRSDSMNDQGNEDDDGNDDSGAFMDALNTLSRGETSFYNCSVSDVIGVGSDVKLYGSCPDDPKLLEFIMGRFIPAEKALVADVPQHTFKKSVVKEKPQEVNKLVNVRSSSLDMDLTFLEDVAHDNEKDDSKSDSSYNTAFRYQFLRTKIA